jgi:DNA-binding XRE family transcriptional regulator
MNGNLANNIEQARLAHGYTQEQVAHAIGVSRPTYINIESGKKELTVL